MVSVEQLKKIKGEKVGTLKELEMFGEFEDHTSYPLNMKSCSQEEVVSFCVARMQCR